MPVFAGRKLLDLGNLLFRQEACEYPSYTGLFRDGLCGLLMVACQHDRIRDTGLVKLADDGCRLRSDLVGKAELA